MKVGRAGLGIAALAVVLAFSASAAATAQVRDDFQGVPEVKDDSVRGKLKALNESAAEKRKDRETVKPPFEFYRLQVLPYDVLPYVKPNHWSTLALEMKANHADYDGFIQTAAVPLLDMPHAVTFRRDARLVKGQQARLVLQAMLPTYAKTINLDLGRPDTLRPDAGTEASLLPLEPHQMLIPLIGKGAPDYVSWGQRFQAFRHIGDDLAGSTVDRYRYYRTVVAQVPERPALSPHPLTWTTISHILWDGQPPDNLTTAQQQALLDWIHWGGQLIIVAGDASTLPELQDSFLGPYLPADPSAENAMLDRDDLRPLALAYPAPPVVRVFFQDEDVVGEQRPSVHVQSRDEPAPLKDKPVYLAGLRPRPGAIAIPLSDSDSRILAVEHRVGRGRVMVLAFRPLDPAFAAWRGLDTMVQRLLLRRPEEIRNDNRRRFLSGPELTWVRYAGRDLGGPSSNDPTGAQSTRNPALEGEPSPSQPVAAWLDSAEAPTTIRQALANASGISIPESGFVLKVILAYVVALVPLNYVLSRFVLRRREWAWAIAPLLAIGFAVAVERAAAYDLGFDSAQDEVDLLEIQGGYARAHLSRFAAVYSTGRVRYDLSYPGDPTALALPMKSGVAIHGQELEQSTWTSAPVAGLGGLQVQPRSLSMYRTEQMTPLGGRVLLTTDDDGRRIQNLTELELLDATLIDTDRKVRWKLGTVPPGADLPWPEESQGEPLDLPNQPDPLDGWAAVGGLLQRLETYQGNRPEDEGEIRLVGWVRDSWPGQTVQPAVGRHRGVTLVLVHLASGPPPGPGLPVYDRHAPVVPVAEQEPPQRRPVYSLFRKDRSAVVPAQP